MSAQTVPLLRKEAETYRQRALHARANARLMSTRDIYDDIYDDIMRYARELEQKAFILDARATLLEIANSPALDLAVEVRSLIDSARHQLDQMRATLRKRLPTRSIGSLDCEGTRTRRPGPIELDF